MWPLTPPFDPSKMGEIWWPEEQGWREEQGFDVTRPKWPLFSTISKKFLFFNFFPIFFDESILYTSKGYLIEYDPKMLPLTPPFDPSKLGQTRWIVRYIWKHLQLEWNRIHILHTLDCCLPIYSHCYSGTEIRQLFSSQSNHWIRICLL